MNALAERWTQFLSSRRLGVDSPAGQAPARTDYQRDYDRVVFTSAFRRLQDKTQVFPLAESDYIRTRLTHSLEVSCVGRTLGTLVGEQVIERHRLSPFQPADFGAIVATACLAHDIGNPPFGHSGEDAIRHWFAHAELGRSALDGLDERQRQDLLRFEGNAQGFRVLTRLQSPDNPGGLQLTAAVLATFTKYPRCNAVALDDYNGISVKKNGFFSAEQDHFAQVAASTGLQARLQAQVWQRHPLAFLVEAADDICYHIIDFEDGYRLGYVDYQTAYERLFALVADKQRATERVQGIREAKARIEYLRAKAINSLVNAAANAFMDNEADIAAGSFDRELLADSAFAADLARIKQTAIDQVYGSRPVLEIEAAGFEVLGGLLDIFAAAVQESVHTEKPSARGRKILQLLPDQFLGPDRKPDPDPYQRILKITDYVAGMTDTYAVALFKKLRGISLPGA